MKYDINEFDVSIKVDIMISNSLPSNTVDTFTNDLYRK